MIQTEEEYRSAVSDLWLPKKDLFAFSNVDLDCTGLVKAHIDTGNHRPINLSPYRTPLAQREAVSKTIDDLLKAGIISHSSSPWAFPIVIVEKKNGCHWG